ncbi:MAG: hypothetical protein IPQ09_01210 [Myxococcales bacterium]|nr:hypothetical protein [Myxococcales bacterium]
MPSTAADASSGASRKYPRTIGCKTACAAYGASAAAASGERTQASAWATCRGGVLRSGPYFGFFNSGGSTSAPSATSADGGNATARSSA